MALILYNNSIIENFKPKGLTFTEEELVNLFSEFKEIKTVRLPTIINAWCIYGSNINHNPKEFNRIASDMILELIYSHVLYVHDSELDPSWKVTDDMLYKNYDEFVVNIKIAIDEISAHIIKEMDSTKQDKNMLLPQLTSAGTTEDKRVLFIFDTETQEKGFYENDTFYKFSQKVYDYITSNKQIKEPFTIYSDNKAIVIIDKQNITKFLDHMIDKFKSKEEYEICTTIAKIKSGWSTPKKIRKKKASSNNE